MGVLPFSEDQKLLLVMSGIVILAIIAFWPIIDMFVWAGAIAVVIIPLHHGSPAPSRHLRLPRSSLSGSSSGYS